MTMRNKKYYEELFKDYPDVVGMDDFRKMLGGISKSTGQKLMRENRVKHFFIRTSYLIPKKYVINYVLSKHYTEYSKKLKAQI
jgi:hypothetical protein